MLTDALEAKDAEIKRLRGIIEDAPHDPRCNRIRQWEMGNAEERCDCWKSRVTDGR